MLKGMMICEDQELSTRLCNVLGATGLISIKRKLSEYPNVTEMLRTLRTQAPDVIFLSFDTAGRARELLQSLEAEGSRAHVIGISSRLDVALLHNMMRAGVRECLSEPFELQALVETLQRLKARPDARPETAAQVISFLPSKAGVGASTVALNVSAALARQEGTRVLLSDFDLNSGMLDFMLKLGNEHSVMDALERANELDEDLWSGLVSTVDKMHVLHAGHKQPSPPIESVQIRKLIASGAGIYQAMCFDLSGNMEPYSLDIMRDSRRIIVVCTPEPSSLHLARKRLSTLRDLGLDDRVSVVLNRCVGGDVLSQSHVQQLLNTPVIKMIPNNYLEVNRAIEAGKCVAADSKLGKVFEQFALDLLDRQPPQAADDKKKRFLEFFSTARETVSAKLS